MLQKFLLMMFVSLPLCSSLDPQSDTLSSELAFAKICCPKSHTLHSIACKTYLSRLCSSKVRRDLRASQNKSRASSNPHLAAEQPKVSNRPSRTAGLRRRRHEILDGPSLDPSVEFLNLGDVQLEPSVVNTSSLNQSGPVATNLGRYNLSDSSSLSRERREIDERDSEKRIKSPNRSDIALLVPSTDQTSSSNQTIQEETIGRYNSSNRSGLLQKRREIELDPKKYTESLNQSSQNQNRSDFPLPSTDYPANPNQSSQIDAIFGHLNLSTSSSSLQKRRKLIKPGPKKRIESPDQSQKHQNQSSTHLLVPSTDHPAQSALVAILGPYNPSDRLGSPQKRHEVHKLNPREGIEQSRDHSLEYPNRTDFLVPGSKHPASSSQVAADFDHHANSSDSFQEEQEIDEYSEKRIAESLDQSLEYLNRSDFQLLVPSIDRTQSPNRSAQSFNRSTILSHYNPYNGSGLPQKRQEIEDELDSKKHIEASLDESLEHRNLDEENEEILEDGDDQYLIEESPDTATLKKELQDIAADVIEPEFKELHPELFDKRKDGPEYYVIAIPSLYSLIGVILSAIVVILPIYTFFLVALMYRYTTTVITE